MPAHRARAHDDALGADKFDIMSEKVKAHPPTAGAGNGATNGGGNGTATVKRRGNGNGHTGTAAASAGSGVIGNALTKDVGGTSAAHLTGGAGVASVSEDVPKIDWTTFPTTTLATYAHSHSLDIAPAFTSARNERLLSASSAGGRTAIGTGIGRFSPTMARQRNRQRVGKERLVMAVRRDFNAAMVSETDIVTSFLYRVGSQDQTFRMRFEPNRR